MYYKVLMDGDIIDVIDGLACCKYSRRAGMVLRCSESEKPEGIISERLGKVYAVDGWAIPCDAAQYSGTVSLVPIDEATYKTLRETLDAGELPAEEDPYEAETAPPDTELTPAQQRKQAYNTVSCIEWDGATLTVTQAARQWAYYAAEGRKDKTDELTALIAAAKSNIRVQYPDT